VRALDTNVVVRFLTGDDKRQAARARAAIEGGEVFIATTVFLESEWVLRSAYGFAADRIADAFRGLAGLPGVSVERPPALAQALAWMSAGMDFADALHLVKADGCTAFLSFDRRLAKAASALATLAVEIP
jgi:predicted nucleic-acid-binding protein